MTERHTCDKTLWVVIKGVSFNYIKLTVTSHKLMFEGDEGYGAPGSHFLHATNQRTKTFILSICECLMSEKYIYFFALDSHKNIFFTDFA